MSQARITTVQKSRKEWTCGNCRETIAKGEGVRHFAVGFRGMEQHRCMKAECYPTRSELESSAVASVYDAVDSADLASAESADDLYAVRDAIVEACREVASEYESSEMYDINEDLQQRAETLNDSADELEGWEPENDAPEDEEDDDDPEGENETPQSLEDWLTESRESLQEAINSVEIP